MRTYNNESLQRHGVTQEEIQDVIASDLSFCEDLEASARGYNRVMTVGWTEDGRILEVGIEYFLDHDHVFHAKDAGKNYVKEFEERLRSWQL